MKLIFARKGRGGVPEDLHGTVVVAVKISDRTKSSDIGVSHMDPTQLDERSRLAGVFRS